MASSAAPSPSAGSAPAPKPARKPRKAPAKKASVAAEILPPDRLDLIAQGLSGKASAKQAIFRATQNAFTLLRQVSQQLCLELTQKVTANSDYSVKIDYQSVNEMEFHIRFSGDLLVFVMHSNIVTFPDDFGPLGTPYVEADFRRRFFGHIMAYNFMADSIGYRECRRAAQQYFKEQCKDWTRRTEKSRDKETREARAQYCTVAGAFVP